MLQCYCSKALEVPRIITVITCSPEDPLLQQLMVCRKVNCDGKLKEPGISRPEWSSWPWCMRASARKRASTRPAPFSSPPEARLRGVPGTWEEGGSTVSASQARGSSFLCSVRYQWIVVSLMGL